MFRKIQKYHFIIIVSLILIGCEGFLDSRPDIKLVVPETLDDVQSLLNNENRNYYPAYYYLGSDEIYYTDANFLNLSIDDRNHYIWLANPYEVTSNNADWWLTYGAIFHLNHILVVLSNIETESEFDLDRLNKLKGTTHFLRAYQYFGLLQIFAQPYISSTASTTPGVPLKLTDDVKTIVQRSSIQEGYDQIEADLDIAYQLLPEFENFKSKGSKIAVDALRARMYLAMRRYDDALTYATRVLNAQSDLINYNDLNLSDPNIFPRFNEEVIFHSHHPSLGFLSSSNSFIDPELYAAYSSDDLRKSIFFVDRTNGNVSHVNSYSGYYLRFNGLATDEMYLIVAECQARNGQVDLSMQTLNTMLETRWKTGTFVPYTASSAAEAMEIILLERRKQLVLRGLRWQDLRRLNQEPEYTVTLTRVIQGQTYTLPPNDPRYVLLIPPNEIEISGIEQNPR